jgi:hypothetical protein
MWKHDQNNMTTHYLKKQLLKYKEEKLTNSHARKVLKRLNVLMIKEIKYFLQMGKRNGHYFELKGANAFFNF